MYMYVYMYIYIYIYIVVLCCAAHTCHREVDKRLHTLAVRLWPHMLSCGANLKVRFEIGHVPIGLFNRC